MATKEKIKEDTIKHTKVSGTMFIESQLNHYMHMADLTDNGTKMFGYFNDFNFTTTSKVNSKYKKDIIKHLIKTAPVGYVNIDGYFAFKPKLHALSLGSKFLWVQDFKAGLIAEGLKEVKIDDSYNS